MADIEDYGSSGRSRGGHPLFLDQTEARRAEKNFIWDRPPPSLISGSGWPSLHPLSEGLDPPLGRGGGEVTQATKEMTTYQTI